MAIESTIAEIFSPDHTHRRLVLSVLATAGGDIITPIFNGARDKRVCISVHNSGANALTKVALLVSTDSGLAHYKELAAQAGDSWDKSSNLSTLPAGENGQAWINFSPAAYFALYAEGDGELDVVVDIEERYPVPEV